MTPGDDDDRGDGSWADGLGKVRPLAGRDARARPPAPPVRRKTPEPTRFHFPDPGEPTLGFASGIAKAQLRQLQRGRIRPERRVDLHGLTRAEARSLCLGELQAAARSGERCLLVVHGKGSRSAGVAVLRPSLCEWLADPDLGGSVLAFAPSQPEDGGTGATYVLLRRARSPG